MSVSDDGTGMAPEVEARAFEAFFTTKEPGKGSGLGLAQVFGVAKQSGGGIRVETQPGAGTTVSVYLPRAVRSAGAARETRPASKNGGDGSQGRVLVVDDDSAVRRSTGLLLKSLGYEFWESAS